MNRESSTNIHTQLHVKQSRWGPVCDTDSPARAPRWPKGVPCRQGTHIQTHARLSHAADGRNQHDAVTQLSCSEKNKSRHTRRHPPPPQRNPSVAPHCFRVNLLFRTLPTISPPGCACVWQPAPQGQAHRSFLSQPLTATLRGVHTSVRKSAEDLERS